jgi:diacylglycerol kinase (ATP)
VPFTVAAVLNPAAGRGGSARKLHDLRALVEQAGGALDVVESRLPGGVAEAVVRAAERAPRFVAVLGGDGTMGEAATGYGRLADPDAPPMLPIPAGRGNSFYKALAEDRPWQAFAADVLAGHRMLACDVGEVSGTGRRFVLGLSAGFLAESLRATDALPNVGGRGTYLVAGFVAAARVAPFAFTLQADDGPPVEGESFLVAFAGTAYRGGRIRLVPGAALDSGRLDVIALPAGSRRRLLRLLTLARTGAHVDEPGVVALSGKRLVLRRAADVPTELDGTLWGADREELVVEARAGALPVALPS